MSFYPELDNLNLQDLKNRFQLPSPEGEDPVLYYQEIAYLIKSKDGKDFLIQKIDRSNTEQLRAILFALTENLPEHPFARFGFQPELDFIVLPYLQDERPLIVMEVIDGLSRLKIKFDSEEYILKLRKHPSPYVRSSVLRYMRRVYPETALPILLESLNDHDFIVRESAADELGELDDIQAIPYLKKLIIKDSHPDVRQAAETSIEILNSIAC